jgi:hypothetical protein
MKAALLVVCLLSVTLDAQSAWTPAVDGVQHRSRATVRAFLKASGHPNGWPGHRVDHPVPLCAGGVDALSNLQWQETQASYRKDVYERALCAALKKQGYVLVKRGAPK